MMAFGGNNRAHAFFKQHGWTDGGKVEAKYTSRAAELYRQMLNKEVAKSATTDNSLPSSPVAASEASKPSVDFPEFKLPDAPAAPAENLNGKHEPKSPKAAPRSPKAATHPTFATSVKKPIGAKKVGGKTGGLGVRKLTTKVMFCTSKGLICASHAVTELYDFQFELTPDLFFKLYCSQMKACMSRNQKSQNLLYLPWLLQQQQKVVHPCIHVLNTWRMSHQLIRELGDLDLV